MGRTPAPGFPVFTVAVQPDETCHPLRCSAFPASKISLTRTCAVASVRCGSRCRGAASPDPAECRRSETWRREAMLIMQIQEAARANRKFFAAGGLRAGGAALPTVSLRTTTDRPPRSGPRPCPRAMMAYDITARRGSCHSFSCEVYPKTSSKAYPAARARTELKMLYYVNGRQR